MTYNYTTARATARRSILKYGSTGEVVQKGQTGGYDDNGGVVADTADVTITGVITPLVLFADEETNGTSIIKGDSWVYWQSDTAVAVDMQVTLNSETFKIKAVTAVQSIANVIIYERLQLRK
ncbi:unnamed protein product [marine sediment metagenome]|uniref:Uncharacterized protein n=1 Tax=marine sediment metagenome TaxID=412755 RepID=X1BM76_9ZZZZ